MSISITYDRQHTWKSSGTYSSNRPYSSMTLRLQSKSTGPAVTLWGLCDTGADYLCLDVSVANSLGINLNTPAGRVNVTTAIGSKSSIPLVVVNLEMEGYSADVDAIFDSAFAKRALIGRCALIDVLKFGVDSKGWLYAKA
jgi:predicted aspartyl protease